MRLLLDTHIALWALQNDARLPYEAIELLLDPSNQVLYSAASVWEIAIKHRAHPDKMPVEADRFAKYCKGAGYEPVSISERHVSELNSLKRRKGAKDHKDPFDQILICQAKADDFVLLTHDSLFADYEEPCIRLV